MFARLYLHYCDVHCVQQSEKKIDAESAEYRKKHTRNVCVANNDKSPFKKNFLTVPLELTKEGGYLYPIETRFAERASIKYVLPVLYVEYTSPRIMIASRTSKVFTVF